MDFLHTFFERTTFDIWDINSKIIFLFHIFYPDYKVKANVVICL